jgi:multidrug efflux pump subunit AcrA (membrane-fusion protein)
VIEEMVADENSKVDAIRVLLEREKEEIQNEYYLAVNAAEKKKQGRIEQAREQANETVRKLKAQNASVLQKHRNELATAQERSRAGASAEGTRKAAEAAQEQALRKKSASEQLTAALDRLTTLRESLASRLPIKGLIINNGQICRMEDGKLVPFSRWNTASQMTFCLRVAVISHGDAGFILCDQAEHFSQQNRRALLETAQKYAENEGLQLVLASVSEGPLAVTTPQ